jgi:hypothetical protein
MIDTLLNLLFRCAHRRLSRPVTPTGKAGKEQTYIVCLDCGGRFGYDLQSMKIGKRLAPQEGAAHP